MQLTDSGALKPREVAELMGVSVPTVRSLFEREPGVLMIERPETRNKQRYRSMRIPRYVYERVRGKLAVR